MDLWKASVFVLLSSVFTGNLIMGFNNSVARDCRDVMDMGFTESGVYHITPAGTYGITEVYCDMNTDGGGWLIFQRRQDGSVDFYRNWTSYQFLIGNVTGEHWLGNFALYAILLQGRYELRVGLEDWERNTRFAKYSIFRLGGPPQLFPITVGGYSGDAEDSLSANIGMPFSAYDKDNDKTPNHNCATSRSGAWWFSNCGHASLNGPYVPDNRTTSYYKGIIWDTWKGAYYSLKKTEMKLRRI